MQRKSVLTAIRDLVIDIKEYLPNLVPGNGSGGGDTPHDPYPDRLREIIDFVGLEYIRAFLTFRENDSVYRDLLNPNVSFSPRLTPTREQGGPLGYYLNGAAGGLFQNPVVAETSGTSNSGYHPRMAVRINTVSDFARMLTVGAVAAELRIVGDVDSASIRLRMYDDDDGKPGQPAISGIRQISYLGDDPSLPCKFVGHDYRYHKVPLIEAVRGLGWLVLEYKDDTGVDSSNYVEWRTGTKAGGARAYHDGSQWVVVEGETHNYQLFDDSLVLRDDFSVVMLLSGLTGGVDKGLMAVTGLDPTALEVREFAGGLSVTVCTREDREDQATRGRRPYHADFVPWACLGITFSKQRALDKISVYKNGQLLRPDSSDIRRHSRQRQGNSALAWGADWCFGARYDQIGRVWGVFEGQLGPILIANRELSQREMAHLSRLMLGGVF